MEEERRIKTGGTVQQQSEDLSGACVVDIKTCMRRGDGDWECVKCKMNALV